MTSSSELIPLPRRERLLALSGMGMFAMGSVRGTALAHLGLALLVLSFVMQWRRQASVLRQDPLLQLAVGWSLWVIGLAAWANVAYPGSEQFSQFKQACSFAFIPLLAAAIQGKPRRVLAASLLALAAVIAGLLTDANWGEGPLFDYALRALGGPRNEAVIWVDAAILGCVALLIVLLACKDLTEPHRWCGVALLGACLLLLVRAWIAAPSRTSLVVLPLALLLQCTLAWRLRHDHPTWVRPFIFTVVAGAIGVILFNLNTITGKLFTDQQTWQAISAIQFDDVAADSTGFRIQMWRLAYQTWSQHPLTGVGPNVTHLLTNNAEFPEIRSYTHFHSTLVDALLRTGLIGVTVYAIAVAMVANGLRTALSEGTMPHVLGHFLICSFGVFLALNLTDSVLYSKQGWRFAILLGGIAYGYRWRHHLA